MSQFVGNRLFIWGIPPVPGKPCDPRWVGKHWDGVFEIMGSDSHHADVCRFALGSAPISQAIHGDANERPSGFCPQSVGVGQPTTLLTGQLWRQRVAAWALNLRRWNVSII